MRPFAGACCALIFLAATAARADVVVLSDGETVEGVVTEVGDEVRVQLDFGVVSFPKSEVKTIRRSQTALHQFLAREAALRRGQVDEALALARWAKGQGLETQARGLYRQVLAERPDNEEARLALGYRQHEGRWLDEDAYLQATGHVKRDGRWMRPEEAAALRAEERERREARRQRDAELARRQAEAPPEKPHQCDESCPHQQDGWGPGLWWAGGWWGVPGPGGGVTPGRVGRPGRTSGGQPGRGAPPSSGQPTARPTPGQPGAPPATPPAPRSGGSGRTGPTPARVK